MVDAYERLQDELDVACNKLLFAEAEVRLLGAEVKRLQAVICEVFCFEPSHGKAGRVDEDLDILGTSLVPWTKECRLTVVNVLREAASAAKEE